MKNKITLITLCSLFFFSFNNIDDTINQYLLKEGEQINFTNKFPDKNQKSSTILTKKAFDKSGFKLISNNGNIIISEISQARGPKQDEFWVVDCTGKLIKNKDHVKFTFEKDKKEYYLINLDSSKTVGSFDKIDYLILKSKTLNGSDGEFYTAEKDKSTVHIKKIHKKNEEIEAENNQETYRNISLVAVPKDIEKEELYKRFHKEKTIAHFSSIEIKDGNGVIHKYSKGNYILCEGQSIEIR